MNQRDPSAHTACRDTFEFSQGHVTKNQPMVVPV